MKKYLIIASLVIIVLQGCKSGKIEIIPDFDSEYLTFEKVDKPALLQDKKNKESELKKIFDENSFEKDEVFDCRIYIGKTGKIEKIKITGNNRDDWNQKITGRLESWLFNPAEIEGKPVKFRFDLEISNESLKNDGLIPDFINEREFASEVEKMPMPVGGIQAIAQNVVYPEEAKKMAVEGKVFIRAFISESGEVMATKVIKGIGFGCDEAAQQAISRCRFSPGVKDEKPVKVQVMIPIIFKLQ